MDEYREKESEELKGSKRRKEVEMRKRAKGDIWDTRVKVGYSMPLWLKEKINKESLEQGLYQWEYIAKMIKRAENCPEDSNYEQLREENERLKIENEQLKMRNEQLERENERLKAENMQLRVKAERSRLLDGKMKMLMSYWLDEIIDLLRNYDKVLEVRMRREKGEKIEFYVGSGRIEDIENERGIVERAINFLKEFKASYRHEENKN
jgi:FtsZ-binding cell division protein ZapB